MKDQPAYLQADPPSPPAPETSPSAPEIPPPPTEPIMRYFDFDETAYSGDELIVRGATKDYALILLSRLPRSPERTVALRKHLESLDCALRALK